MLLIWNIPNHSVYTYSMLIKNNVIVSSTYSLTAEYCIIVYMYVRVSRYMM